MTSTFSATTAIQNPRARSTSDLCELHVFDFPALTRKLDSRSHRLYYPVRLISYFRESMQARFPQPHVLLRPWPIPTRRAILARLRPKAKRPSISRRALRSEDFRPSSKHLKVLQRPHGLVSQSRQAQWRPSRLEPVPLGEAVDGTRATCAFWAERFGQLDTYLVELQKKENAVVASP